jgi:hypothetical protein
MDVDASAAAPATSNEINIQRKQRLQSMVYKRKQNLALLKKTLQGGAFWLNCVRLSEDDIRRYVAQAVPSQRTVMYLYLSLSVSQLLASYDASTAASSSSSSAHVVRAFLQLLEEYEYYFAGTAVQSVKYLMAKTSPTMFPATTHAPAAAAASAGAPSSSSVPQSPPPSSSSVGNAGGSAHGAPPPIGPSALAGLADDASDPFFSAHTGPGSGGGADLATSGKGARGPSGPTIYKFDGAAGGPSPAFSCPNPTHSLRYYPPWCSVRAPGDAARALRIGPRGGVRRAVRRPLGAVRQVRVCMPRRMPRAPSRRGRDAAAPCTRRASRPPRPATHPCHGQVPA